MLNILVEWLKHTSVDIYTFLHACTRLNELASHKGIYMGESEWIHLSVPHLANK